MKGVIVRSAAELVEKKFGKDKWEAILEKSGLPKDATFAIGDTVDDKKFMEVLGNLCKMLGITTEQTGDAFGEYWYES